MLTFLAPSLLVAGPAAAALGLWALWRGRHQVQRVSSTRLWAGLTGEAAGKRSRAIDPVWLLVFAAAVLAGLALAGPQWVRGAEGRGARPEAEVQWSLRAIAGAAEVGELFVSVRNDARLPDECELSIVEEWGGQGPARVVRVKTAELRRGKTMPCGNAPVVWVALRAGGATLAEGTFVRRDRAGFALLTSTGRGGRIDPALLHLFSVHPAVRTDEPTVRPAVLLVDDPQFRVEEVDDRTLVVASPRTPMPGIRVLGAAMQGGAAATEAGDAAPRSEAMKLGAVRVKRYVRAEVSAEWKVVATVEGMPWIAVRSEGAGRRWVWLASNLMGESNWGVDVSFVVFFGEMLDQMYAGGAAVVGNGESGVVEWTERREAPAEVASGRVISCVPGVGAAAVGLLLLAVLLLLRRVRVGIG